MTEQSSVRFAVAESNGSSSPDPSNGMVESLTGGPRPSNLGPRAKSDRMEHFLDLADPANRNEPTSGEVQARLEQKRLEYEKQREKQKHIFEAQMKALQAQQEAEEAELLAAHSESDSLNRNSKANYKTSASAPASPPIGTGSDSSHDGSRSDAQHNGTANGRSAGSRFSRSKSGNDLVAFGQRHTQGRGNSSSGSSSPVQELPASASSSSFSGVAVPNAMTMSEIIGGSNANGARKAALPSKSLPASRRHSKNEDEARSLANGLSKMTVSEREGRRATSEAPLLTSFLFDDELDADLNSSFGGKYLAMNTDDDDKFPILVRRDSFPGILSASSAALDLAPLSQTPPKFAFRNQDALTAGRGSEWPSFNNSGTQSAQRQQRGFTAQSSAALQPPSSPQAHRSPSASMLPQPPSSPGALRPPGSGRASPEVGFGSPGKRSIGLGMSSTAPNSPEDARVASKRSSLILPTSNGTMSSPFATDLSAAFASSTFNPYTSQAQGMPASQQPDFFPYGPQNGGSEYGYGRGQQMYNQQPQQARGYYGAANQKQAGQLGLGRRIDEETNRFAGLRLEDLQGDMASLCTDQHGCRFLQRKLEEGNPEYRDMIFAEIYPHFAELMTDSFGNYLAQRLLEFSTDEQKSILIDSIHNDLVNISLNIHGTRAIQRLIDHLTTPRQIQSLVKALNPHVVLLIKDLNGNHVIQKCLNSLKPEENQFIYNAVAENCVEVATHRHGCCVLQRCLDHATETQRVQLVTEITYQCLTLVQDPFSNYVVQYCLEFDRRFVGAIIRQFQGNVCALSCHKFSSNVIEKCLRVAEPEGKRLLIGEMLERGRLERLVKDNFANYVVQTACDFADPIQREQLVSQIRPLLPMIRNTPYGKRIAARIQRGPQPQNGGRFVSYQPVNGGFAYAPPPAMAYGHPQGMQEAFMPQQQQQRAFSLGASQMGNPMMAQGATAFMPFAPQQEYVPIQQNNGFGPAFL